MSNPCVRCGMMVALCARYATLMRIYRMLTRIAYAVDASCDLLLGRYIMSF
jgi:hypothetical protein